MARSRQRPGGFAFANVTGVDLNELNRENRPARQRGGGHDSTRPVSAPGRGNGRPQADNRRIIVSPANASVSEVIETCVSDLGLDANMVKAALVNCPSTINKDEAIDRVLNHIAQWSLDTSNPYHEPNSRAVGDAPASVATETIFDSLPSDVLYVMLLKLSLVHLLSLAGACRSTRGLVSHHLSSLRMLAVANVRLPAVAVLSLVRLSGSAQGLNLGRAGGPLTVKIISAAQSTLRSLDLTAFTDDTVPLAALRECILHTPLLTQLAVSGTAFDIDTWPCHVGLESLTAIACGGLDDECLTLVLQRCPKLTALNLARCNRLSKQCLGPLQQYGQALTTLDLSHCNRFSSVDFKHGTLTILRMNSCPNLQTSVLDCPALTELHISNSKIMTSVTIARAPVLSRLVATNCRLLEQLAVLSGGASSLTELNLFGCRALADVTPLLAEGRLLENLDLNGCSSVEVVRGRLPRLLALDCTGMRLLRVVDLPDSPALTRLKIGATAGLQAWRVPGPHRQLFADCPPGSQILA